MRSSWFKVGVPALLVVALVAGGVFATVPGQPWWFPDYYYNVDHVDTYGSNPQCVFESVIAWDRSNDNGEWFGLLEDYDHEIRWGGSQWSSESELRSKYDYQAAYSNLPGAYATNVEWNSGENRAELEIVSRNSDDIKDKTFYYVDFWMDDVGTTTKTVEVFIKSEYGYNLYGDPLTQDYRFIGKDCFVPNPPNDQGGTITIYPPTKTEPSCSSSLVATQTSIRNLSLRGNGDISGITRYVQKKKAELAKLSGDTPAKRVYSLVTFKQPISIENAMEIVRGMEIEGIDVKYTNSYALIRFDSENSTKDRVIIVTENINRRHRELGIEQAELLGIITVRGYGKLETLQRISGDEIVALADFDVSGSGRELPFIYYDLQQETM